MNMNNNPLPNNDANGRPAPAASPSGEAQRRRILLVDDHPMMRAGLVQLIDKQPDLAVFGEAGDAAGALAALEKNVPDLLITDITLPGRSGIELIKDVRALHGEMPILVLTLFLFARANRLRPLELIDRFAMSAAVAALVASGSTTIRDTENIDTSFPGFARLLRKVIKR